MNEIGARRIVAAVTDLLIETRLKESARRVGVRLDTLPPARVPEVCRVDPPALVVVDLTATGDPLACVRILKSHPATAGIRTVGFYPHVDQALRRDAVAAGIDEVVPRSALANRLPAWLAGAGSTSC
jgi:hypothetical protein